MCTWWRVERECDRSERREETRRFLRSDRRLTLTRLVSVRAAHRLEKITNQDNRIVK